jgi:hypothetical protein
MKFKLALDEKGLTREDLPKSQQLKIKEIEKLKTQIEQIESDGVEDSFQDEFDEIKLKFDQADEEVVVFIRNFDVEKSRKQRERLADMRSRIKKPAAETEVKAEEPSPEPEAPATVEPFAEPVKVEEPKVQAPIVSMPPPVSQEEVAEKLEALKREAQVYPEQFEVEEEEFEPEAEEVEAEEEFEKVGNSKPRKLNVPLVIMGVGALLLTWGAVNFFKNKE